MLGPVPLRSQAPALHVYGGEGPPEDALGPQAGSVRSRETSPLPCPREQLGPSVGDSVFKCPSLPTPGLDLAGQEDRC